MNSLTDQTSILSFATLPILMFLLAAMMLVPGAEAKDRPSRALDIGQVQIANGVTVPPDYVDALQKKLQQDLSKKKIFTSVQGGANQPGNPDLQLTWTITRFKSGNRAERLASSYGAWFGVGATRLDVHAQLRDPLTNVLILDREIKGSEKGGLVTGSKNVVNTEADKITHEVIACLRKYSRKK